MTVTDNRTPNFNIPLPHAGNQLPDDLDRLVEALTLIDVRLQEIVNQTQSPDAASISGQDLAFILALANATGVLPLAKGGTGATDAAGARTALGFDAAWDAKFAAALDALPEQLDTLAEITAAIEANESVGSALNAAIAALQSGKAATVHTHSADDITIGVLDPARLPANANALSTTMLWQEIARATTGTSSYPGGYATSFNAAADLDASTSIQAFVTGGSATTVGYVEPVKGAASNTSQSGITFSASHNNSDAWKAINTDTTTGWSFLQATGSENSWWQVDLGADTPIEFLSATFGWSWGNTHTRRLRYRTAAGSWVDLHNTVGPSTVTSTTSTPFTARYIRVELDYSGAVASEGTFYVFNFQLRVASSSSKRIQLLGETAAVAPNTVELTYMATMLAGLLADDVTFFVSRNGGANWTEVPDPTVIGLFNDGSIFQSVVDVSGQPAGTDIRVRADVAAAASIQLHSLVVGWSA